MLLMLQPKVRSLPEATTGHLPKISLSSQYTLHTLKSTVLHNLCFASSMGSMGTGLYCTIVVALVVQPENVMKHFTTPVFKVRSMPEVLYVLGCLSNQYEHLHTPTISNFLTIQGFARFAP